MNTSGNLVTALNLADKADQTALDEHIQNTSNPHGVTAAQVGAAASGHTHDERYYTENEVDSKLNGKSDTGHKHSKSDITDFPTSLPASDVYSWAKASSKPSYSASEVGAAPSYSYGTSDLTAGSSSLATGKLYFVYG